MGKRIAKADEILIGAKIRLANAKTNLAEQQRLILAAELVVQAHQEAYDALELALAPKPRSNGTAAKPKRASKAAADTKCSKCGDTADGPIHDKAMGYAGYHAFLQPSAAPSAKRRSSSVSASPKAGDPSTLVMSDNVITASSVEGASDGN